MSSQMALKPRTSDIQLLKMPSNNPSYMKGVLQMPDSALQNIPSQQMNIGKEGSAAFI